MRVGSKAFVRPEPGRDGCSELRNSFFNSGEAGTVASISELMIALYSAACIGATLLPARNDGDPGAVNSRRTKCE